MSEEKPHSLREDAEKEYRGKPGDELIAYDLRQLGVPPPPDNHIGPWPPCTCGRYQCRKCQQQREIKAAIDAEIERRKKLKGQ